jgi:virginiamycin B lyase
MCFLPLRGGTRIGFPSQEVLLRNKIVGIFAMVLVGAILAIALPNRSQPRPGSPADVGALHVAIREWAIPTKGGFPHDPAVGADGALWFTEQMANKLGRLEVNSGEFKEYPLVEGKNSGPHGLVADADGNIWFTANFGGYIGKLDPTSGKVSEYKMPSDKADDPHSLVFDAQGTLWFTVQGGNMVGSGPETWVTQRT